MVYTEHSKLQIYRSSLAIIIYFGVRHIKFWFLRKETKWLNSL